MILTTVAFGILALARTPMSRRAQLLDLIILLVGGASFVPLLLEQLVGHRHLGVAELAVVGCTPFAALQLIALGWMLRLPGRRPRSLALVMVGVVLMSVQAVAMSAPDVLATHRVLRAAVGGGLLLAFACWAKAASHPSAAAIADQAEDGPDRFGSSRLLLFAVALTMLPVTLVASSILHEENLVATVSSSLVLGALVLLRFRSMFRSVQQSKAELAAQENLFRSVVESVHDLILITERDGTIIYRSPAAMRAFGQNDADSLATRMGDEDVVKLAALLEQASAQPGDTLHSEVRVDCERDGWRIFDLAISDVGDAVGHEAILWSLHDVTDRSRLEEGLRHQALHDSLTGLPNRVLAADRIGIAAARARRNGSELGVLFVDLDNFKHVNDSLGHAAGDELLRVVATRLLETVREVDTVARLGGDEFAVIVEDVGDGEATALAERIRTALRAPVEITGTRVSITASVGIALETPEQAGDLLRHADVAMYEAKALGKDFVVLFTEGMASQGAARLHLEMDLIDALEAGDQLVVHYQPIVGLADQQVIGAEALVRWQHPSLGLVPPM
jgi:diguanylate cyclase (GGDEF)-like protein/PAS domain S-box-containing protein